MWDLSSLARDHTRIPCIGRWTLNHWTSRRVPQHLDFGLPASRTVRKHLLFKLPSPMVTLLWQPEQTNTSALLITISPVVGTMPGI